MELVNENKLNKKIVEDLSSKEPEWLKEHRINSYEKFKDLTIPSFRYGLSIILRPEDFEIDSAEFVSSLKNPAEIKTNKVNSVEIFEFNKDYDRVKKYMNKLVRFDKDKFSSFHNAFFNKGLFIRIPKNTEVEEPLILERNINERYSFEYIIILAEPSSKIKIVDNSSSNKNKLFRSKVVELFLAENSRVTYLNVQDFDSGAYSFNIKGASIEKNAELNWIECVFGSHITKAETKTNLNGEGSSVKNFGIFFGNNKEQFDFSTITIHNSPRTSSDMLIKGALDNNSKAVYRGTIHIKKDAPFSSGYQKEDTLLLGPGAEADPIPELLIDNNNVKCSHGASIGEIDKEKLFYMMSRGLNEREAKEEFVKGFFNPVLDKIKEKNIQEDIRRIIEKRLKL